MADSTHNIKLVATLDSSQIKLPQAQQSSSSGSGSGSQIAANFKNLESAIQRLNSSIARLSSSLQRLINVQQQTINISRTNIARSQVDGTTPIPGVMSEKQIAGTSKAALGMIVTQALGPISDLLKTKGHDEAAYAIKGASSIASGAMMGAAAGSFIPGIGTAIGASVGALTSGIGQLAEQLNEAAQKELEARERIAKMLDDQFKTLTDLNKALLVIDIKDVIKSGSDKQLGEELEISQISESALKGQFRSGFETFKSTMEQIGEISRKMLPLQEKAKQARRQGQDQNAQYYEDLLAELEQQKAELTAQAEVQKQTTQQSLKELNFREQIASMLEQEVERRKRAAEQQKRQEEITKQREKTEQEKARLKDVAEYKARQTTLEDIDIANKQQWTTDSISRMSQTSSLDVLMKDINRWQELLEQYQGERSSAYAAMMGAHERGNQEDFEKAQRAYNVQSGNVSFAIQMRETLASGIESVFKEMQTYKGLQIDDFGQLAALGGFGSTSVLGDPMLDLQREQNRLLGEMLRAIRDQDNTARYL